MTVSIIIPAYNEEKTIRQLIDKVVSLSFDKQIIVVDDGSTDATAEILGKIKNDLLEVVTHGQNIGKGAAIRTGLRFATGEIVVIQDADLELDPNDIIRLVAPIENGEGQAAFGARIGYRILEVNHLLVSMLINIALSLLQIELLLLYGYTVKDMMVGYKVMPLKLFKDLKLESDGFEVEAEIIAKLLNRKLYPINIPVHYTPRYYRDGKKIMWFDAFKIASAIARYRFSAA